MQVHSERLRASWYELRLARANCSGEPAAIPSPALITFLNLTFRVDGAPCDSLKMFFMRSVMRSAPAGVISPMSPVWNLISKQTIKCAWLSFGFPR